MGSLKTLDILISKAFFHMVLPDLDVSLINRMIRRRDNSFCLRRIGNLSIEVQERSGARDLSIATVSVVDLVRFQFGVCRHR